jgi:DNA-binding CsgD family transcriptional regulator
MRWPRIAVHVGRACLHARVGEDEAADEHFRAALALHQEVDLPLHRTEALLAYGTYLRRRGRSVDARVPLAEARQIAEATDAAWLAERARRELALAGGRRRRAAADRDQLTAAERRVAELAAEGLANGEIARQLVLSVNTIESHLRRIYAKLSISSRRELMRLDGVFEPPSSVRR